MTVEILYFHGCPHPAALAPRIREMATAGGIEIELRHKLIADAEAAERERFLGSPTVRVNGADVEPGAGERDDFGMKCRLYRTPQGLSGMPSDAWIREAIAHGRSDEAAG
jgi:hypothetical protein